MTVARDFGVAATLMLRSGDRLHLLDVLEQSFE
jgi:hypothetical protein